MPVRTRCVLPFDYRSQYQRKHEAGLRLQLANLNLTTVKDTNQTAPQPSCQREAAVGVVENVTWGEAVG